MTDYIEIAPHRLSPEALQGLMEDFIAREGTDYGEHEYSLKDKLAQLRTKIDSGVVLIVFDPVLESCNLLAKG